MEYQLSLIMDEIKIVDGLIEEFQFVEEEGLKNLSIRFMENKKSMLKTTYLLAKATYENTLTETYKNALFNKYKQLMIDTMEDYEELVENELIDEGTFLSECAEMRNFYNKVTR